jgi:hypothetical protein
MIILCAPPYQPPLRLPPLSRSPPLLPSTSCWLLCPSPSDTSTPAPTPWQHYHPSMRHHQHRDNTALPAPLPNTKLQTPRWCVASDTPTLTDCLPFNQICLESFQKNSRWLWILRQIGEGGDGEKWVEEVWPAMANLGHQMSHEPHHHAVTCADFSDHPKCLFLP